LIGDFQHAPPIVKRNCYLFVLVIFYVLFFLFFFLNQQKLKFQMFTNKLPSVHCAKV